MRWLLICLAGGLCGTATVARELPTHEEARQVMGTVARVQVWAVDAVTAGEAADQAFAVFTQVDSLMSTWNGHSPLSRLNRAPAGEWVTVGAQVCEVISAACRAAQVTGGAFDPTVLPLVRAWGFRGSVPVVPELALLAQVLDLVDVAAVEVSGTQARLMREGMSLDLGGIAKGYALDRAATAMKVLGVRGGVLDLGGNLLIFGQGPGNEVGIVDPQDPDEWALTVPVHSGAVATSGQYERFVTINGRSYGHILDPRTGWPVAPGTSVTVIAGDALWADALATAAVVLGGEEALALLEKLPEVEGVVIAGGRVLITSGLRAAGVR